MIQKISGRPVFICGSGSEKSIKHKFKLSLLGMLIGIFLLPNLAYLASITPEEIIALTNQKRQAAGLNALIANQLLTQAAIAKGRTILELQTFKHSINDKTFSSWIRDTGYNYSYVGENLAIDFTVSKNIVEAWNNSPLHKKNLLSPYYQEIGVAAIDGKFQGQGTTVVVQIFGAPAFGSAQPLTPDSGLTSINLRTNFLETGAAGYYAEDAENLLTHSILNRELLPAHENKLIIPAENNLNFASYKFIVQPIFPLTADNFFIIYISLTLIYLIVSLYYYYFIKINKLASI